MEKRIYQGVSQLVAIIIKHQYLTLILSVCAALIMASGIPKATLDHSYKAYLSNDTLDMLMINHIEENYIKEDNITLLVHTPVGTIFTAETLNAIREFTNLAWQMPNAIRVDSLSNYQYSYAEDDDLFVDDLIPESLQLNESSIAAIQKIALNEPQLKNLFVSESGNTAAINIFYAFDERDIPENLAIEANFRKSLEAFKAKYPEITFLHTGMTTAHAETVLMAFHDLKILFSLAAIFVLLSLYFFLRNWISTLACIGVILLTITAATGLVGYSHTPFTLVTSCAPIMIMTLAIADSIHILMAVQKYMRQGMDKKAAIIESYQQNFIAVLLTTVTTTAGFLSFNFSSFAPLVGLGNIVSVGIILAFLFTLFFLPAFLSVMPLHITEAGNSAAAKLSETLATFITEKRKSLVVIGLSLCAVAALLLPMNKVTDDMITFYTPESVFRQGLEFTEKNLTGGGNISISIESNEANSINDIQFLQRVERFIGWLYQQEVIRHVSSYTDTLKRINKNMHGDDPAYYQLPESRELAAQYLLLYELSLPFGLDLGTQLNLDKSGIRIVASNDLRESNESYKFFSMIENKLKQDFPEYQIAISGGFTSINKLLYESCIDTLKSSALTFIAIGIILMISFRSFWLGIIGMSGVVLPLIIFFGLWAIIDGEIGISAIIVLGIALGIVVDNSVHLISKFNYARITKDYASIDATLFSVNHIAPALVVNTIVLGIGFYILSFADYKPNATLGLMSSITFFIAIVICFLLVAPLLTFYKSSPAPQPKLNPINQE